MNEIKKKIFIVYQYYGTDKSKWSTRWFDFSQHFVEQGYDVTIITSNFIRSDIPKASFYKTIYNNNVKVVILPFGDGNNYAIIRRIINSLIFCCSLFLYLFFNKADRYIFSSGPITASFPILFLKKYKTILEIRDLWPEGGFEMKKIPLFLKAPLFFIQKKIYHNTSRIITCSPAQKDAILNKYPKSNLNIDVIEHGLDPRVLEKSNELYIKKIKNKNDQKYWVVVATFGYIHNPFKWLNFAQKIHKVDSKIKLILIGSGPLLNDFKDQIKENKISNIILTGQINKNEMSNWIQKADFCLFTTLNNKVQLTSAPNKIYDYMCFRKLILIDLDMWLLRKYEGIIFKVDFENFSESDLLFLNKKNNSKKTNEIYSKIIPSLYRNNLADIYLK